MKNINNSETTMMNEDTMAHVDDNIQGASAQPKRKSNVGRVIAGAAGVGVAGASAAGVAAYAIGGDAVKDFFEEKKDAVKDAVKDENEAITNEELSSMMDAEVAEAADEVANDVAADAVEESYVEESVIPEPEEVLEAMVEESIIPEPEVIAEAMVEESIIPEPEVIGEAMGEESIIPEPEVIAEAMVEESVILEPEVIAEQVVVEPTVEAVEEPFGERVLLSHATSDDMSFSEAFAAARAEVGANGVFEWRGGYYGTYYAEEWAEMPADYKREFSNHNWAAEYKNESVEVVIGDIDVEAYDEIADLSVEDGEVEVELIAENLEELDSVLALDDEVIDVEAIEQILGDFEIIADGGEIEVEIIADGSFEVSFGDDLLADGDDVDGDDLLMDGLDGSDDLIC
jgi:hypothetical protein